MLAKYTVFTVITSVISFWCVYQVQDPYQHIHDFYNTFCIYLSKRVHKFLSSRNILTCVSSGDYSNSEDLSQNEDEIFTKESLSKFTSTNGKLYLSILGEVFDVTKGKKHYGEGEGYHGFTGRDGSRAFITGDFSNEGFTDDVLDLSAQDLKSLSDWSKFYHKEYAYKGKLVGRYYDCNGRPTSYYYDLQKKLVEAEKEQKASDELKLNFPPCNVEFDASTGSRVWCSTRSGGVERDWIGVPRKIYKPGSKSSRCACMNLMGQSTNVDKKLRIKNIEEYKDCHPQATSCHVYV